MKRLLVAMAMLCVSLAAVGQNAAVNGFCTAGGKPAKVQGASAANFQQEIIPSCTVTVYLTGTLTLATVYSSGSGPLSNPFTANAVGSVAPGQWIFYAAAGAGLDIVLSGGIPPNTFLSPVTLTDVIPGGSGGGGAGNPAPPSFAVQLANSGATAFAADPNITINTSAHSLTVGAGAPGGTAGIYANPLPLPGASPTGTYQRYAGLPTVMNVMTDCPALTGLAVVGDGITSDTTAIQQCIWQRLYICETPGVTCVPQNNPVTAWAISGSTATFTATNSMVAGQTIFLKGFVGNTCFNNKVYNVLSSGLSGSQFEATTTCTGTSGSEGAATFAAPGDYRYPHPVDMNSTGVTFFFPQRSYSAFFSQGCSFYLPGGIQLPWSARIEGQGTSDTATQLCFADGDTGVYAWGFNHVSHLFLHGADPWTQSDATTFILPIGFGGAGTGDGIFLGTGTIADDLFVRYFGRHGFNISSADSAPGGGVLAANQADAIHILHSWAYNNRGDGFHFSGGDGGVGLCDECHGYQNQLYGIFDNSLYADTFNTPLVDGNHADGTTFTGTIPSISSTTCTTSVCTVTTSSSHSLNPGDLIQNTSCSDAGLNANFTLATASGSTYTFPYISPFGAENPTGCAATYRLGTHAWAIVGNTVPGTLADGGAAYCPQGHYIAPYAEGDQPLGTCIGTNPDVTVSVVENPQGTWKFQPYGALFGTQNSISATAGNLDIPYNSNSAIRQDSSDASGGIGMVFENIEPGSQVLEENAIYSESYLRRTFYGPGQNGSSNLSNWQCFMLTGSVTGTLTQASGCFPDQTMRGLLTVTVTNGGSGYTSPTYTITNANAAGSGAAISCTVSGGVIQNSCTITNPGAGYNPNALVTVHDPIGTGAIIVTTIGNVASTDSGRTALNGLGLWYMPQNFCFGTLTNFVPSVCWTTGTAAPTTGTWKLNDFVYNTSGGEPFGWINIAAGTPGIWTDLTFGSDSNNAIVQFSTNAATNMTSTDAYYFVGGSPGMAVGVPVSYGVSAPFNGLAKNLQVTMSTVVAAGNSVSFQLYDGNTATGITCTMNAVSNTCNDSTHSFSVTKFDTLAVVAICTGTCGANSTFALQASVQLQ